MPSLESEKLPHSVSLAASAAPPGRVRLVCLTLLYRRLKLLTSRCSGPYGALLEHRVL